MALVTALVSRGSRLRRTLKRDTHKSVPMTDAGTNGVTARKALVGSWVDTVTFPPETGLPPLKS